MHDPSKDGAGVRVSCVIPTRDRWALLEQALSGACGQQGVAHEVIVVDDGSREPAPPALRAALDAPRVRLVRHERSLGVAAARNRGIAEARGAYVAFLDDDDLWSPDHLARLVAAADAAGAGFAFAGKLEVEDGWIPRTAQPAPPTEGLVQRLLDANVVGTPSGVLARTDVLERTGGFDSSYSVLADWDLWLRLAEETTAARVAALTVVYRVHDGNMHLDTPGLLDEHRRLSSAVGARLGIPGLRLGGNRFDRWVASIHRRRGERAEAAGWYLRSWRRTRDRRDLLRAIGMLFGERAMAVPPALEWLLPPPAEGHVALKAAPDEPAARVLALCATDSPTSS